MNNTNTLAETAYVGLRRGEQEQGGQKALSTHEAQWFAGLELTIRNHVEAFDRVIESLLTIKQNRLYRQDFGSWEEYVREKWPGIGLRRANQLVSAGEVVERLKEPADGQKALRLGLTEPAFVGLRRGKQEQEQEQEKARPLPKNERQTRALAQLPASEQKPAWDEAVSRGKNGKGVTGKIVESVVRERRGKTADHGTTDNKTTGRRDWPKANKWGVYQDAADRTERLHFKAPKAWADILLLQVGDNAWAYASAYDHTSGTRIAGRSPLRQQNVESTREKALKSAVTELKDSQMEIVSSKDKDCTSAQIVLARKIIEWAAGLVRKQEELRRGEQEQEQEQEKDSLKRLQPFDAQLRAADRAVVAIMGLRDLIEHSDSRPRTWLDDATLAVHTVENIIRARLAAEQKRMLK